MPYPKTFGQPCWTRDQVGKVIPAAATARTNKESIPYFLAAHSPFRRIANLKAAGHTLSEEEVFAEVFTPARKQVAAFVTGEPGTGKSHLIRWLRLRAGYAAQQREAGLDRFKLVLVSRATGSLKDALTQIVSQLGEEFQQHLRRVQTAIDRVSDSTARAKLLAELALEVDTRWTNEHHRSALHRSLRHLGQALRSNGFGNWLKCDGGVIHQAIERLAETSTPEERENPLMYTANDFDVPLSYLKQQENSPEVLTFADDLKEEQETRELAAEVLNTALQDAIRGLIGMKGTDLLDMFTEIRRELGPSKALAVFIEDVSATSGGLDLDIINAFEPRDGDGLCRMVTVLGIVDSGWDKLQKNQKDRGTHIYEVGGMAASNWAEAPAEVAQFTARYLNAVRCSDEDIQKGAQGNFSSDVWRSKCDDCPHKLVCHETFGKVTLNDGVEVGTFPYTATAPQALLMDLSEVRYRSQRGLLTRVLLPVLDQSFDNLVNGEFPRPVLFGVASRTLRVWAGFTNAFCSSAKWDDGKCSRLLFLAKFWVPMGLSDELRSYLEPLLMPFGFPEFSRGPKIQQKKNAQGSPTEPPVEVLSPQENPELNRLLQLLDSWKSGDPLKEDNKFRDLLGEFLAKCIVWEDNRGTPIAEKKRLIAGNKFPRIEEQVMKPGGSYFFDFKRDAQTYALLQSLLLFARNPSKTWDFDHGELHKRELSRWLRRNSRRVVFSVQPEPAPLAKDALRGAVEVLALVSLIRDRRKFPKERVGRLHSLLAPIWDPSSKPLIVSPELKETVDDLELRHSNLREFVVQEVGCGQGDAYPKDFVDPVQLLRWMDEFEEKFEFHLVPSETEQSYWGPRFHATRTLSKEAYTTIPNRIEKEREAVGKASETAIAFIEQTGVRNPDLPACLDRCLAELVELINLQRSTRRNHGLPFSNDAFDELWKRRLVQSSDVRGSWAVAIGKGGELQQGTDSAALMAFNPIRLKEAVDAFKVIETHLCQLDVHLSDEEKTSDGGGDSRSKLLDVLKQIEEMATQNENEETTV